jgi:hypothetical protein
MMLCIKIEAYAVHLCARSPQGLRKVFAGSSPLCARLRKVRKGLITYRARGKILYFAFFSSG